MKTCVVFGSAGLLGEAFCRKLASADYTLIPVTRAEVDLRDSSDLSHFLDSQSFDLVVNCAGMTGLEQCMDHPEDAKRVNTLAPKIMAEKCERAGAMFVHFSTDYVFDGNREGWVDESDPTNPVNHYGLTKLEGELAVRGACPEALIARVSWIFGQGRASVVEQVLDAVNSDEWPKTYISDKYSIPNYADDLVDICLSLLAKQATGVVHLCSAGPMSSWHMYASEIIKIAKELELLPEDCALPQELLLQDATFFRATRPKWTAMKSSRLESMGVNRPDWQDGLRRFLLTVKGREGNR